MRLRGWFFGAALLVGLPAAGQEVYEIGPEDILKVVILGQAEMSGDFTVDPEGMLTFPILGKVKAAGMAPEELERKLTTLLADGYLKRPQVSLSIKEYRSQRVFVTGEVPKSGPYPLKGDRSLRALLDEMGNLGPEAGHEIVVTRTPRGSPELEQAVTLPGDGVGQPMPELPGAEIFRFRIRDVRSGGPDQNMLLRGGDKVHVPRAAQIYIMGYVARPGPYRFQEETTVLHALTVAGGVTERGSSKRVKIIRIVDGEKVELKAKMTEVLQPGDTIVVAERFF